MGHKAGKLECFFIDFIGTLSRTSLRCYELNIIEYREKRSDAIIAAIGSAVFHLCMIGGFLGLSLLGWTLVQEMDEPEKKEAVATVLISPELFEKVIPDPPEPPPPLQDKRTKYLSTNPEAPTTVPTEEANYISERSTQAASETPLEQGDPNLPTQFTREPERETPTLYDSTFSPGETQPVSQTEISEDTQTEDSSDNGTDLAVEQSPRAPDESKESDTATAAEEIDKTVESENSIETLRKKIDEELEKAEEERLAKASLEDGEEKSTKSLPKAKTDANKSTAESGFKAQKTKTKIIGSLSRDGKSSLNAKSTELGKYYATISKIIEKEWQMQCIQYQEHIQPGIISMQFSVSKDGKVSNPSPVDVVSTSGIQQGFTMKAIRKSKLPPMPAAAQKELGQDKLDLIYNFYF